MEIKEAATKEDFLKCWDVIHELRPQLDQEKYLVLILHMLDEGYKMIFTEEKETVVSVCGYRYVTMLHRGRSLYIDDLCTLSAARGKGYAGLLLKHLVNEARKRSLQSIHLDSGHQRHEAHRLYLNHGFKMTSHHFVLEL